MASVIHQITMPDCPFVTVNCKDANPNALMCEIFGETGNVLTGDIEIGQSRLGYLGRYDLAQNGTLLIIDIQDMPKNVQEALLNKMLIGKATGGGKSPMRPRVIATASSDLIRLVHRGRFSRELYEHLSSLRISIPRLADRPSDIRELAINFARQLGEETYPKRIDEASLAVLEKYSWPGNIGELRECIRYALIHCDGATITLRCLPKEILPGKTVGFDADFMHGMTIAQMEKMMIQNLLTQTSDTAVIAGALGIGRTTLYRKIKEYDLETPLRKRKDSALPEE